MHYVRRLLFIALGMNGYLLLIRRTYFVIYKIGLLRRDPVYDWHYFVQNLIRKGDVIIDIGANMGYYSFIFSELTGNRGRVYSIEPVKPLIKQLTKQVRKQKNVSVLPMALGDENKNQIRLNVPVEFRKTGYLRHGLLSIQDREDQQSGGFSFGAIQRKGSEVFNSLDRIDYIKCDVEGYEKAILEDMKPLLITHQPLVQVEIRNENFPHIVHLFEQLGYVGFKLEGKHLTALEDLPWNKQQSFDTLFVSSHRLSRIRPYISNLDAKSLERFQANVNSEVTSLDLHRSCVSS